MKIPRKVVKIREDLYLVALHRAEEYGISVAEFIENLIIDDLRKQYTDEDIDDDIDDEEFTEWV